MNLDPPNASNDSIVLQDNFSGDPNKIVVVTADINALKNSPFNCEGEGYQDPPN